MSSIHLRTGRPGRLSPSTIPNTNDFSSRSSDILQVWPNSCLSDGIHHRRLPLHLSSDLLLCVWQTEEDEGHRWQKMLYQKISKKGKEKNAVNTEFAVSRMLVMGKVLYGLHLVKHCH